MMTVNWARPATRPRSAVKTPDERRAFQASVARIGSHLRGRVVGPVRHNSHGHPIWRVEVYNAKTGSVLQSDQAFDLADAINDAHEHASIARLAWFYGFTRKALR